MATDPTWQAPATYDGPAYFYDPSWFTGPTKTQAELVQEARDAWRAKNPNAPYMPSDAELGFPYAGLPEMFPGLVMSQEGAKAYDDLLTAKNNREGWQGVLTTAGLAALPFAAASFMAPAATGTLGGGAAGVEALGGIAPELAAPLSTAGSDLAASQIALGGIPGLEAAGGVGTLGGMGTLGGLGFEAPALMGSVAPELTAPLSTLGSDAAFAQLMADPILSASVGLPAIPSAADLAPVASVPTMTAGGIGGLLSGLGGGSSGLGSLGSTVGGLKGAIGSALGGANLGSILGAVAGAATSGDKTQTTSRDPWGPSQDFLKSVLGDADTMRQQLNAQPFTPQQTQQYGQAYAGLDQARAALPGLLSFGQQAMQRQSTVPSYDQLFGNRGGGLLTQPQPTMQAGGPGGLLMDPRLYR